ncbi:TPA: hypothetical protein NKZ51_004566 [Vibrio parahaemolyticus]|uniref:DUF7940 domain-containing protein n=1 Tax=Photobacterium damselae TaxID=38293 RepID=UPI000D05259C|nr:hypothetical protein [Photobacterium damselae]PSB82776.1 hypothetical protein C5F61_00020 [Photobacterium damselae subsp. damselae]HCH5589213.1 hypothetical protein [Vibrio parahaemolyticus]
MKLIENWKKAWRLWSVQCAFFIALVNIAISLLPLLQQELSITVYAIINALLGVLLAVLRVLSQAPK